MGALHLEGKILFLLQFQIKERFFITKSLSIDSSKIIVKSQFECLTKFKDKGFCAIRYQSSNFSFVPIRNNDLSSQQYFQISPYRAHTALHICQPISCSTNSSVLKYLHIWIHSMISQNSRFHCQRFILKSEASPLPQ